jgi:hypothetical protein
VQQQFSGLPAFLQRSGTIEGFVFLDPEMRGVRDQTTKPLPDIAITLDSARTARTDGNGAYVFAKVPPGPHRIAAQLPESPRRSSPPLRPRRRRRRRTSISGWCGPPRGSTGA